MGTFRYFIKLAYNGALYHGWQRQPNGISIQQALEDALTMMLRQKVSLTGAGRTDAGVHAMKYYAHFDLKKEMSSPELKKLVFKLNSFLPEDIAIYDIYPVPPRIHARFTAISRTYQYYISTIKNPFRHEFSHFLFGKIDLGLMNQGGALLKEFSDFTSFSKVGTDTNTNICHVISAYWEMCGQELVFTITADRFLRNMVRAIVGTLLELGTGKISLEEMRKIIESRDRSNAGDSVPACGLFLMNIEYPSDAFAM